MIILLIPILVILFLFFICPFVISIYQSFYISPLQASSAAGFTFLNYQKLFGDFFYLKILLQTLMLGIAVSLICLLIAFPVSYVLARNKTIWNKLMVFLVISPLVISIVIRSYGWMVILGRNGTVNNYLLLWGWTNEPLSLMFNWFGVILSLVHVLLPYMILALSSTIEGISENLEDAAHVLGANWIQRFWYILLPLSIEGIGNGLTLVFMLAIGSFVTVLLLGSSDTLILPLMIYRQIFQINNNFAAAIGVVLLIISISILYLQGKYFQVKRAK